MATKTTEPQAPLNIDAKLLMIQSTLKVPKLNVNAFASNKYKYRTCGDILEVVKPLCEVTKCVCYLSDELVLIGDRYYIKATAWLNNLEEPFDNMSVTAFAREEEIKKGMDGSQITGASSSYARKYALNGLFAIDDTADSDVTNDGTGGDAKQEKAPKRPTKAQQAKLENLAIDIKADLKASLKYFGVEKIGDLDIENYTLLLNKYNRKAEESKAASLEAAHVAGELNE